MVGDNAVDDVAETDRNGRVDLITLKNQIPVVHRCGRLSSRQKKGLTEMLFLLKRGRPREVRSVGLEPRSLVL